MGLSTQMSHTPKIAARVYHAPVAPTDGGTAWTTESHAPKRLLGILPRPAPTPRAEWGLSGLMLNWTARRAPVGRGRRILGKASVHRARLERFSCPDSLVVPNAQSTPWRPTAHPTRANCALLVMRPVMTAPGATCAQSTIFTRWAWAASHANRQHQSRRRAARPAAPVLNGHCRPTAAYARRESSWCLWAACTTASGVRSGHTARRTGLKAPRRASHARRVVSLTRKRRPAYHARPASLSGGRSVGLAPLALAAHCVRRAPLAHLPHRGYANDAQTARTAIRWVRRLARLVLQVRQDAYRARRIHSRTSLARWHAYRAKCAAVWGST